MEKFYDYKRDGVTQSLLQSFLRCRQEADWNLKGYTPLYISPSFTYGTIVHGVLEKIYEGIMKKEVKFKPTSKVISKYTKVIENQWLKENPRVGKPMLESLQLSLALSEKTLPVYFDYWWEEDFKSITWRALEHQFKIPYVTKDGRKTFIRGKRDGDSGEKYLKLFETKTKSQINVDDLILTLWFEFQVRLYLWAMKKEYKQIPSGVTYNIIRKTQIYKYKDESINAYADRVTEDVIKRPDHYFIRLEISVTPREILEFEKELEGIIVDFMNWQDGKLVTYKNSGQCINKYGTCPFLQLCSQQNFSLYTKRKSVFKELNDL